MSTHMYGSPQNQKISEIRHRLSQFSNQILLSLLEIDVNSDNSTYVEVLGMSNTEHQQTGSQKRMTGEKF